MHNANQTGPSEGMALMDAREARQPRTNISSVTAWWTETLSLFLAIGAFIVITTILAVYDNQEQPAWKYNLNLSTLVAILSTSLRASLVVIIEEGNDQKTF